MTQLPAGPVELWVIVFTGDGEIMGSAAATARLSWRWQAGRLMLDYGPVRVRVHRAGTYETALICAAVPSSRVFVPLWPVSLDPSERMQAGDDITIDGFIAIIPDLPGPHG